MNISITPELAAFVTAKVESGDYNNASEVIRAALRVLKEHGEWKRILDAVGTTGGKATVATTQAHTHGEA